MRKTALALSVLLLASAAQAQVYLADPEDASVNPQRCKSDGFDALILGKSSRYPSPDNTLSQNFCVKFAHLENAPPIKELSEQSSELQEKVKALSDQVDILKANLKIVTEANDALTARLDAMETKN